MYKPLILFLSLSVIPSECAKILGAVFTPSYSHQIAFQPIWKELSLKGHQVTVLTTNPIKDPKLTNLTEIDLSMSYDIMKSYKATDLLSSTNESLVVRLKKYMEALHAVADAQLSHPQVQQLLNKKDEFDLLMVEAIYPTQMALSWWFQVPFIGMISLDAPSRIHSAVGNPVHPVLYPDYDLPFTSNLSFKERIISSIFHVFMLWYAKCRLHPREEVTLRKYFGDDVPSIEDIQKNMSMLFINVNPIFHNPRPLAPSTVQIGGGMHLKTPEPLPKDIQEYLDDSKNGFVYFSLGTTIKSSAMHNDTKTTILNALKELPYNVLWKFEDAEIENKPNNVKIAQWVPQTAVLSHPNIKAFITQCGLQSMEEAIFYTVPMVGLPFYGDQGNNAKVLENKGLGIKLDPANLNKEELVMSTLTVISDPIYKENIKNVAQLLQDEPMADLEKAIWWTEYVIRHKGAKHLRSPSVDVPLYQYLLLDVLALFIVLFAALIFSVWLIFKIAFRILYRILGFFFKSRDLTKKKN